MNLAEMNRKLAENDMKISQLLAIHKQANSQDASVGDYEAVQAKADAALQKHGKRAGPALVGEPVIAYRRRLASEVQRHAPKWADMPLSGVRTDAFPAVEAHIYADAASAPLHVPPGELRAIPKTGYGGHAITEYHGDPRVWMDPIAGPVRQFVKSFRESA